MLLEVQDLVIEFGGARAVDGLSFSLAEGETLGVVGESGCGKSVTALSLLRLLPPPPQCRLAGRVRLSGKDILSLPEPELRRIRGREIGMVFQEPMTALNPVVRVGTQIAEGIALHEPSLSKRERRERVIEMLSKVGIGEPERRFAAYPHELSGGMRQRAVIAMALACRPRLLVADEPTTALDVTVQAQILDLVRGLQKEMGMAVLWISHDLGVVSEVADRVLVMYAGQAVEMAESRAIFTSPLHPYTRGLTESLPPPPESGARFSRLKGIAGHVPDPRHLPPGCRFEARCQWARPHCRAGLPPLEEKRGGRRARCFEVKAEEKDG